MKKRMLRFGKSIARTSPRNSRRRERRANRSTQTVSLKRPLSKMKMRKSTSHEPNSRRSRKGKKCHRRKANNRLHHHPRRIVGRVKLSKL